MAGSWRPARHLAHAWECWDAGGSQAWCGSVPSSHSTALLAKSESQSHKCRTCTHGRPQQGNTVAQARPTQSWPAPWHSKPQAQARGTHICLHDGRPEGGDLEHGQRGGGGQRLQHGLEVVPPAVHTAVAWVAPPSGRAAMGVRLAASFTPHASQAGWVRGAHGGVGQPAAVVARLRDPTTIHHPHAWKRGGALPAGPPAAALTWAAPAAAAPAWARP